MNMPITPSIRQAVPGDAHALARLIDIAGEGIPHWLWSRQCADGQSPLDIGAERARRRTGGFSFTNALIAEDGGAPAGMVLSYAIDAAPDANPDDLPPPIAPFVALERLSAGTWFVNALAVFPGWRGMGIGSRLLQAAEGLARAGGTRVLSIQVYAQNTGALQLYERLGFRQVAREPVRLHPCQPYYTGDVLLLTKPVGP